MKLTSKTIKSAAVLLIFLLTSAHLWARSVSGPEGGVVITNMATATYEDETGATYESVSPIVTVTVSIVAGVVVTPDETAPSDTVAPNERVTRVFRVCNTGNTSDTFTLTNSSVTLPATIAGLHLTSTAMARSPTATRRSISTSQPRRVWLRVRALECWR